MVRDDMFIRTIGSVLIGLLCVLGPALLCTNGATAQANISIVDFQSELISQSQTGTNTIRTYQFILFLRNNGSVPSEELIAQFIDPDGLGSLSFFTSQNSSVKNFTINSGETKVLYAKSWPTLQPGAISVNVSYGPASPQIPHTSLNSGYAIYEIAKDTSTSSTPGFELAFVFLALLLLFGKQRKKKK